VRIVARSPQQSASTIHFVANQYRKKIAHLREQLRRATGSRKRGLEVALAAMSEQLEKTEALLHS
jgi:hypothetical protein